MKMTLNPVMSDYMKSVEPDSFFDDEVFADEVRKDLLRATLDELQEKHHAIYLLLVGLPKGLCYIRRDYDVANDVDNSDVDVYSIREFFEKYEEFHFADSFGLFLKDGIEREEPYSIDMWSKESFTAEQLLEKVDEFLEGYCEHRYRINDPLLLTPKEIARFGFSAEDVAALRPLLNRHNRVARKKIRAEYRALESLDFIRKGKH